ncbi:MAG: hypothetical protein ACE5J4_01895 [Candidatus Aenigmatarchaeota archaeon]
MNKKRKYVLVKGYRRKIATRKHKKRALRIVIFFIILILSGFFEDITAFYMTGAGSSISILFQRIENVLIILMIAIIFTIITEFTEKMYEGEKPKDIIKKTAKAIKKKEKIIGDKLKKEKKKSKRK